MRNLTFDRTNALCGALFIATGLFFLVQSLGLEIGTAFRMGPGYFPLVLAIVLIVLGAILLAQKQGYMPDFGPLFRAWWPLLLILAGIVILVRKR